MSTIVSAGRDSLIFFETLHNGFKKTSFHIDQVEKLIRESISVHHISVEDLSGGCGAKFNILVVSDDFKSKSLLDRQRMVNQALRPYMDSIHALTIKCITPEIWEEKIKSISTSTRSN